jgi:hypothetical protein
MSNEEGKKGEKHILVDHFCCAFYFVKEIASTTPWDQGDEAGVLSLDLIQVGVLSPDLIQIRCRGISKRIGQQRSLCQILQEVSFELKEKLCLTSTILHTKDIKG